MTQLAIDGGPKAFNRRFPPRHLFGPEEKDAAMAMFDKAIETGVPMHYNGAEEEAYCAEFARFMGGGFCDAVNSGASAIYVALRALDIQPFTEVIVPAITDAGGAMPVALINCIPVVADTNLHSYNVGPEQVEACITEHTSAIIVAHITGIPVDMDPILELAQARNIKVIEDCAQAHGSRYKGRLVGSIGDVGAFSTMSIKHHATASQGGLVFTKDPEIGQRARRASDRGKPFGLENQTTNVVAAHNMNQNDLAAAVGRVQLRKLPGIIEGRRKVAAAIASGLEKLQTIRMVGDPPDCESVYWFLVFDVDPERISVSKERYAQALAAEGLPFASFYIPPMTEWTWFRERAVFGNSGYPWAAPEYKGDPDQPMPMNNFHAMDKRLCRMDYHENLQDQDIKDIVAAFAKVDEEYAK